MLQSQPTLWLSWHRFPSIQGSKGAYSVPWPFRDTRLKSWATATTCHPCLWWQPHADWYYGGEGVIIVFRIGPCSAWSYLPSNLHSLSLSGSPKRPITSGGDSGFSMPSPNFRNQFWWLCIPAIEDMMMLDQVISDKWISHLGQPLYEHLAFLSKCHLSTNLNLLTWKGLALSMMLLS